MKRSEPSTDALRAKLARALSDMYETEMPRYREMGDLVRLVNKTALGADTVTAPAELDIVQHGAIRVGTARELDDMRRLFAVMGMFPVGYYNLVPSGIPVHSTAFRPIDRDALRRNPFRVFTSLLRLDLIHDAELRDAAAAVMHRRDILTPRCRVLLEACERDGGLDDAHADDFVSQALETFRWRGAATTTARFYERLRAAHPLLADIVCFKGPHLNHLTLRTLDIDAAQRAMSQAGLDPKPTVEGPPGRRCPILLRQTSFRAQAEPVAFEGGDGATVLHMARFGEIEQRGAALTEPGRALYDRLLSQVHAQAPAPSGPEAAAVFEQTLARVFAAFPDDSDALRREKLAFFEFSAVEGARADGRSIEELLAAGVLKAAPIVYDDFLPVSAAGIFRSNLAGSQSGLAAQNDDRDGFETALGTPIIDAQALYQAAEEASLERALAALGLNEADGAHSDLPT
ncbi:DUF1338 family protein [Methylocystis sp. IM3]|uniref:2-oxoadipate dioxygenase/decarboxylase HglS n=1 Tax=unclassified Methylocystis TaxID=2625913 RepID=UPI0030FA3F68